MKKRVLFIDEDTGRTGSTVSLEYLVKGFAERNYDVFVATAKQGDQFTCNLNRYARLIRQQTGRIHSLTLHLHFTCKQSFFSFEGMMLISKDVIKFFYGLFIYWQIIRKVQPDLIYLNEYSVMHASIVSCLLRIPSVVHMRSLMVKGSFGLRRYLVSKIILHCNDKIFAISDIEAGQLHYCEREAAKIYVIGEFFPLARVSSVSKHELRCLFELPNDAIVVTMLGGILDIKGSVDFLRAAVAISVKYQNITFALAGKNYLENVEQREYYRICEYYIKILQASNTIRLIGEVINSLDLIQTSDIIVSPSVETHFPRPVIEAWGFEKPVVVAETAHSKALITHGVNGLLFLSAEYNQLAECIARLIEFPSIGVELGKNGKKNVVDKYDAEKNLESIVEICTALV